MNKTEEFYESFEKDFTLWAKKTDDIRAAFVVGSRSRVDHPADEWSDLDIILYARNSNYYLNNTDWLKDLGNIWVTFAYQTSGGEPERLTLFEGGYQVDIVFLPCQDLYSLVKDRSTPDNFYRGVRVLVDKDNVSSFIVPVSFAPASSMPVDEGAFNQVVNMFFFAAVYIAKQIVRGELWTAKTRENELRQLLLQMLEWHAKALHSDDYDVWHSGRFLHEWANEDILRELKSIFSGYGKKDSLRGLLASISLFRRIAVETADKFGLKYPVDTDKHITGWIMKSTGCVLKD